VSVYWFRFWLSLFMWASFRGSVTDGDIDMDFREFGIRGRGMPSFHTRYGTFGWKSVNHDKSLFRDIFLSSCSLSRPSVSVKPIHSAHLSLLFSSLLSCSHIPDIPATYPLNSLHPMPSGPSDNCLRIPSLGEHIFSRADLTKPTDHRNFSCCQIFVDPS
jgi:hypothetical protein